MKQLKKAAIFLLAVLMTVAPLSGCAKSGGENVVIDMDSSNQSDPSTVITFFGYKADAMNLVAIEAALRGYMDLHPDVLIKYEGIKGQPYWDSLEKRKNSDKLDDIINIDHDHLAKFVEEGRLADLSGLSTIDDYDEMSRSQFLEDDGSVYFLPNSITTYGLYVNVDLLKQHNFEPPSNLKEFTEICNYFTAQGTVPLILNNFYSLRSIMVAKGIYPIYQKEDTMAEIQKINSGEYDLVEMMRPSVELVASMLEQGWIDPAETLETNQTSDDLELFAKGDRPFMVSGAWATPRVQALEPGFTYAVYPLPVLDDSSVVVMELATCISLNADSPHLEEVMKFIEFFTQKDVMWKYCDSQSSLSPLKDDRAPTDPTIVPSLSSPDGSVTILGSNYNLKFPLDSALRECATQMLQGMDVDGAMALLRELLSA